MKEWTGLAVRLILFLINTDIVKCQYSHYGSGSGSQTQIKIAGIFDDGDPLREAVLKHAVQRVNQDASILPGYHLTVIPESIPRKSSFHTTKAVCKVMGEGIAAVFGPQGEAAASHTSALCDRYDIPHIETKWDFRIRGDRYAINIAPHPDSLGRAYADLVEEWEWDSFVIIYDSEAGLVKLQDLIKTTLPPKRQVLLRLLPEGNNFRTILKRIQRQTEIKNIIIDANLERTMEVLQQAQQVGMTNYQYKYILTTLDIQPFDLEEFRYGDAYFHAFRMIEPTRPEVLTVARELSLLAESNGGRNTEYAGYSDADYRSGRSQPSRGLLNTDLALVYDAVTLFAKALHKNLESVKRIRPINCDDNDAWTEGASIINDMKAMVPFQGLTGLIQFNNSGYRTDITLEVLELFEDKGLVKSGTWDYARYSKNRFNWEEDDTPPPTIASEEQEPTLFNKTLKVTMILNPPMCMYAISEKPLIGNKRFEGFSVDLTEQLAKELKFNYTLQLVASETYPGMIDEVKSGVADIVVADLSISKSRQLEVDLTMPFMNLGISILFVTPKAKPPSLFSFMSPFALEVWIYVAFAFFGVSFSLFFIGRLTPYEWDNPFPCKTDPDVLQNQFSLSNSFWFTIGSIMQQGSDVAPKAVSTRMIAGIWWFFTLIMVSSYTANLASFLIVQELDEPIKSLEDLAAQTKIQYGCVQSGSTADFFKNSNSSEKLRIWENMKQFGNALKSNNKEGIDHVKDYPGKFAFFMESTIIEYNVERVCGLAQVGGFLDSKGYGIALKKPSPFLNQFNGAVLKLQETGKLDELKRKWWKEERKTSTCTPTGSGDGNNPLKLANVGGVFVVLVGGCILSMILTCFEFMWKAKEVPINEGESRIHEIVRDLQFALQCRGNVRPVKGKAPSLSVGTGEEMGSTPYIDYRTSSIESPPVSEKQRPNFI